MTSTPRALRAPLLLTAVAALAVLPGLAPGAEGYLDNAPHILEVWELSQTFLPEGSWTGWSDRAQAGQAVGQLNAPLPWSALALLVWAGLPPAGTYLLCAGLANIAFALGVWRLAGGLLDEDSALLAAAIAACSVADLYGLGGATGGMWPFRLANGVLALGMLGLWRQPRLTTGALWLGVVLLTHTFTAVIAVSWALLCAVTQLASGRRRHAATTALALILGLTLTAGFWLPLTDGALTASLPDPIPWTPTWTALTLALPVDPFDLQTFDRVTVIGGSWAILGAVVTWLGALASLRVRGLWRGPALALAACAAGLVLVIGVVIPLTGWRVLGPNPWRYYAFVRLALALAAGAGLGALLTRPTLSRGLIAALTLCAVGAGLAEIPARAGETAEAWDAMEATWAVAAADAPTGRVYVENTFRDPRAPVGLQRSHAQALMAVVHPVDVLGTWYGITATPTHPWTTSAAIFTLGAFPDFLAENPDWLHTRFGLYGVSAVVSHSPELTAALAGDDRYTRLGGAPPFTAWRLEGGPREMLGAPPPAQLSEQRSSRDAFSARVSLDGEVPFRLRQSYHPWWTAALDGAPIPLHEGESDGLVTGTLDRSGLLELRYVDRGRSARWISLLGLLLLVGFGILTRRGPPVEEATGGHK